MLPQLLDFGLSNSIIRYTPLDKGRGYVSTVFMFKALIALTASIILYIFSNQIAIILARSYIAPMLRILAIYVFSFIIMKTTRQILIGTGEYRRATIIDILRNMLRILTSIALILAGLGIYGAIWGFAIASIVTMIYSLSLIHI